ncbi:response regulator, partial [Vibrio cholerae]
MIIDDAQIVVSNLRSMLVKIGFMDSLITTVKSPKTALFMTRKQQFDIIICDYNFGKKINGKQLFEELKYYKIINAETIFILITGEASSTIVQSILELRPDDYILKPFNKITLKERLVNSILRKHSLKSLYQAELDKNYEFGLKLCDELEPFHLNYYFTIQKFRGEFLTNLHRYEKARDVYLATLKHKEFDWAKIGLANSLKNTGHHIEAMKVIQELLATSPNNIIARMEAASISLNENSIPEAIQHIEIASQIVPGHADREWALANLCLSVGDSLSAFERYKIYVEMNRDTYRNNLQAHINLIRFQLFSLKKIDENQRKSWLQEARFNLRELYEKWDGQEEQYQIELIAAHIFMEEGKYSASIEILNKIYQNQPLKLFEDHFHFCWLLNAMSFDSEFSKSITLCNKSLLNEDSGILLDTKIVLGEKLRLSHEEKIEWLENHYEHISKSKIDLDSLLEIYINIL